VSPVTLNSSLAVAGGVAVLGGLRALSRRPRVYRHTITVDGLAPGFAGYRIAQISDIHCGPFTPEGRVRRWVEQVNELGADLVAVTGDLITSGADHVAAVAGALSGLRARDGVFGCMGNHDYFTDGEAFAAELGRRGLPVLRNRGVVLERAGGQLYLCGVDDTWTRRHDIPRALRGRPPGVPAVLLAHDPALFAEAAAHGVALTLSGHTHGGQLAVPVAPRRWNLARLMTPFTVGLYRLGSSVLYVNRGLGTTGPPVRMGARPEIAVLTLVPASPGEAFEQPAPQSVAAAE
jgi:predicted MPP superfamily phosphohydrolase